jgi:hypothetical protein
MKQANSEGGQNKVEKMKLLRQMIEALEAAKQAKKRVLRVKKQDREFVNKLKTMPRPVLSFKDNELPR